MSFKTLTRQWIWLLSFVVLALTACNKDDDTQPADTFGPGIFIVNEGPFQNGTGSISFWDRQSDVVLQSIYFGLNGEDLGNIAQSMTIANGQAFIVVNNAGKVVAADAATFMKNGEITGLSLPRYMVALEGTSTAFVSQWGATGTDGSVAVVNTDNYTVTSTIPTGSGAETMLLVGDELWVANSGGFGRDSTISIIDVNSHAIKETIVVGDNPNSLVQDSDGNIWVICAGYAHNFDPNDPLSTPGKLVRISNKTISKTFELPNDAGRLIINSQGNRLFYLDSRYGGRVFDFFTNQPQLNTTPFLDGTWYSLGYDPVENTVLAGNAGDFSSPGSMTVVDATGNMVREVMTGIIPTFFVVRE